MPVVDGFIQLPPDSTGKQLDASQVTVGGLTRYRERGVIADPVSNNYAGVTAGGLLQVDASGATVPVSIAAAIDVSDRSGRLLGHVAVDSLPAISGSVSVSNFPAAFQLLDSGGTNKLAIDATGKIGINNFPSSVDVTDRTARLLGHVTVDNASIAVTGTFWQSTQPVSIAAAVDISDRAARLLGVIYGSQGQQLKQTATNFNAAVELFTGATAYDARQIRTLTSADIVSINGTVPVSIAATLAVKPDGTTWTLTGTSANVNVTNTVPISGAVQLLDSAGVNKLAIDVSGKIGINNFPSTQAVTAASWPLPTNAAQEGGGNLDLVTVILNSLLAQMKLLNLNFASCSPSAHVDTDTYLMDTVPGIL